MLSSRVGRVRRPWPRKAAPSVRRLGPVWLAACGLWSLLRGHGLLALRIQRHCILRAALGGCSVLAHHALAFLLMPAKLRCLALQTHGEGRPRATPRHIWRLLQANMRVCGPSGCCLAQVQYGEQQPDQALPCRLRAVLFRAEAWGIVSGRCRGLGRGQWICFFWVKKDYSRTVRTVCRTKTTGWWCSCDVVREERRRKGNACAIRQPTAPAHDRRAAQMTLAGE